MKISQKYCLQIAVYLLRFSYSVVLLTMFATIFFFLILQYIFDTAAISSAAVATTAR